MYQVCIWINSGILSTYILTYVSLFSLPSDFFDTGQKVNKSQPTAKPVKSILTNSTKPLLSQYSSDSEDEDVEETKSAVASAGTEKTLSSGLPAGMVSCCDAIYLLRAFFPGLLADASNLVEVRYMYISA